MKSRHAIIGIHSIDRCYLDGSVVAADIVDAEKDALAVLLLVSGSEIALQRR